MAPEYVFSGRLTEKADVYSFGIVVIEVVCGRQNYAFTESTIPLLEMVHLNIATSYFLPTFCQFSEVRS